MAIYVISEHEDGPCKIGLSSDGASRVRQLQIGNPGVLTLSYEKACPIGADYLIECALHDALGDRRACSEWFRISVVEAREVVDRVVAAFQAGSVYVNGDPKDAADRIRRALGFEGTAALTDALIAMMEEQKIIAKKLRKVRVR